MSSLTAESNDGPPQNPTPLTPVDSVAEVASALENATPKTLPLKRSTTPLFVQAALPEPTALGEKSASEVAAESPTSSNGAAEPADGGAIETELATQPNPGPIPEAPQGPDNLLPVVEFWPPTSAPYNASLTVELRCSHPRASIRYALNADDVSESDLLYSRQQKIFLTESTAVAARAFLDGQSGPVAVGKFEIIKPLWQKVEPVEQIDPTAHEQMDEEALEGPWHLAAASVRGKLHAHRGAWREDALGHGLAHAGDGTYSIVVVSDGAGSAALSRVGSNLLCQTVLTFLSPALQASSPLAGDVKGLTETNLPALRALLVDSARLALQKLEEEAERRACALADFASTLLILVRREWNGQQLCAALQAGDGAIALWNEDETLTMLGEADHGQHSSETRFLTTQGMEVELPSRVKFSIRPNLRAVAVMTDGVADDFFPETERFPELFHTLLPLVSAASSSGAGVALLDWIGYEKKGSSDDRTLVFCWHEDELASSPGEARDGKL